MPDIASLPLNQLGQPIGFALSDWTPRLHPPRLALEGLYSRLEPLEPAAHAPGLFDAFSQDSEARCWTYLPYGPFSDLAAYRAWLDSVARLDDPLFHVIIDKSHGQPAGVASYLRIDAGNGVIEVGHINLAPTLQRSRAATEAMYLMAARVFDELGYRRFEWKCDAANAPSMSAALRLGFSYEGLFRQATIYKGRNRDTAWFSIIDKEWPAVKQGYEHWLAPDNFDAEGKQISSLKALREA